MELGPDWGPACQRVTLALIARIRELEKSLGETRDGFSMLALYYEKGVPLHKGRLEQISELLEKGARVRGSAP